MAAYQYVTLVSAGGTPVRLADQSGAPYPTTGNGALVFANGATLTNVTIVGQIVPSPLGLSAGSVSTPSLYFSSTDRGLYSQGSGDISIASHGAVMASFEPSSAFFTFNAQATSIKLFSDFSGEAVVQGYDLTGSGTHQLTLQKYGANLAIGQVIGPVAGGDPNNGNIHFTPNNVLFGVGTGAPTLSAPFGSLYLRNDSSYIPYVNNNNTTGWEQIITANATQTLTNKTLTAPVIAGAVSFTGQLTVAQGVITANLPVTFTQTWNNGAINFTSVLINSTKTAEAGSSRLLSVQLAGSDRFYVDQFGTVIANAGGFFGGNMNIETGSGIPAGGTQDVGVNMSTTAHFGVYFGSGAATSSQHQGSIYLRSDGYPMVNTNGTTGWDTLAGLAANQTFSGTNNFTTQSASDNSTKAATTAFVQLFTTNIAPTTQNLTSGSGATYTTPANVKWIKVRFVGGGGGGGGVGGTTAPTGGTGGTTTFNSVNAVGGSGGVGGGGSSVGGIGGTGGTGTATLRKPGNMGGTVNIASSATVVGGSGGVGAFGGGVSANSITSGSTGTSGAANSGSGGVGANGTVSTAQSAAGGGAGEYVELIIGNPAATYTYTIGAGGTGGVGTGTAAATGGAGGTGFITVEEHYGY